MIHTLINCALSLSPPVDLLEDTHLDVTSSQPFGRSSRLLRDVGMEKKMKGISYMHGLARCSPDSPVPSVIPHSTTLTPGCSPASPGRNGRSRGEQVLLTGAPPRAWQQARCHWALCPRPEGSPSSPGHMSQSSHVPAPAPLHPRCFSDHFLPEEP